MIYCGTAPIPFHGQDATIPAFFPVHILRRRSGCSACPAYFQALYDHFLNSAGMRIQDELQLYSCWFCYSGNGNRTALLPIFRCAILPVASQDGPTVTVHANATLSHAFPEVPGLKKAARDYLSGCTQEQSLSFARFHTEQVQRELPGEALHPFQ